MENSKQSKEITQFKHILLRKEQFSIDDSVAILQEKGVVGYGKIFKIWQQKKNFRSFISISWYYRPDEVFKKVPDFISEAELFQSTNLQDVQIEAIIEKIVVLPFSVYHSNDEVENNVFFTRALFNHLTKTVFPCLSNWIRVCYCDSIINPDVVYNKCDGCLKLFHFECCEFKSESENTWLCRSCLIN